MCLSMYIIIHRELGSVVNTHIGSSLKPSPTIRVTPMFPHITEQNRTYFYLRHSILPTNTEFTANIQYVSDKCFTINTSTLLASQNVCAESEIKLKHKQYHCAIISISFLSLKASFRNIQNYIDLSYFCFLTVHRI
jgi:hypothetical protein